MNYGYHLWVRRWVRSDNSMPHISRDRRWLEQHGGKWRVTVAVPRSLHHKLGTRLKQALGTDSLSQANRLKLGVVHELRLRIQRELEKSGALPRSEVADALEIRKSWREAASERALDDVYRDIARRGEEILGGEVGVRPRRRYGASNSNLRSRAISPRRQLHGDRDGQSDAVC